MAKKIIWSNRSHIDIQQILEYWYYRNGNKKYSDKLNRQFKADAKMISHTPLIGRKIENKDARFLVSGNYLIIYRVSSNQIEIITVRDARRNPDDLIIS